MAVRRQRNPQREVRQTTARVVEQGRKTREALSAVIKLCSRTRLETRELDDAGLEMTVWRRVTPEDQLSALYQAMSWLQKAENEMRTTRTYLERATERAERIAR